MRSRITIYAAPSQTDPRPASASTRVVANRDLADTFRLLGLEWKNADYMPARQVVIVIDSVAGHDPDRVKELVQQASTLLEETGLL